MARLTNAEKENLSGFLTSVACPCEKHGFNDINIDADLEFEFFHETFPDSINLVDKDANAHPIER